MMWTFESLDWWDHPRGRVAVVASPQDWERDTCPFLGKAVLIDGKAFTVCGVESHVVSWIRTGEQIGLLVAPVDRVPPPSGGPHEMGVPRGPEEPHPVVYNIPALLAEMERMRAETERLREALRVADEMRQHLAWFAKRQWPLFVPNQEQGLAFIRRSGIAAAAIDAYDAAARALRASEQ